MKSTALCSIIFLMMAPAAFAVDTTKAVIHHTASPDVSAETIDGWHKARGWDGIGYHYVIRQDGSIEPGRPLTKAGAHARNGKPYSRNHYVGIALTGYDTFTKAQIDALARLIRDLGIEYVEAHHEKCPGTLNLSAVAEKAGIRAEKLTQR